VTRLLAMSSWVSVGHVGLSAMAPVLQPLGHEVIQLPTVLLSNHTGWPAVAGRAMPPDQLGEMIDAIGANGWLAGIDALLAGYMPGVDHVEVACEAIRRLARHSPAARIVCDPVLGDDPKGLYVDREAAKAVRDRLAPLAEVLTPNRFELAWLTGCPAGTIDDAIRAARALAERRPGRRVLVTSPPIPGDATGVLEVSATGSRLYATPRRDRAPNGIGDVFSALIAAGLPTGTALGQLLALIDASAGAPHLVLADGIGAWRDAAPVPYRVI